MAEVERGNKLVAEAKEKLNSSRGFFSRVFGGQSKIEEACELYTRAANSYKMAKKWTEAGNAFQECAKLQLNQMQSKHEAASQYVEAANCYRKGDFDEAISSFLSAIEIFADMGRFAIAAKHHVTIAEIYESNLVDIDKAAIHYTQAADYYKGEESTSAANKCMLKVATFSAQQEDYLKAVTIFEEVASVCLESSLLKYSAREYLFKAALCNMCLDVHTAQSSIEKYNQMFPAFEDSREYKLLKNLLEAAEEGNSDKFTDSVREYDAISRLDQWYTTLLLRIKKSVCGEMDIN